MIDMSPHKAYSNRTNPEVNTIEVHIPAGTTNIPNGFFAECKNIERVYLPESVQYIGEGAFRDCSRLQSIHFPSGLKEIGLMAFWNCTNLRNITIPDTVVKIGNDCFNGAGLTSVTLPSKLEVLEECVFSNCSALHTIVIPESIKEIHNRAFYGSGLHSIRIPANVKVVGEGAFGGCEKLTDITICSPNTKFVKCVYPMFVGFDGFTQRYKLHGNGYSIPSGLRYGKIIVAGMLLCGFSLYALLGFFIYTKFKYPRNQYGQKEPWKNIVVKEFIRPWYERVPVLDGMKIALPDHLLFYRLNNK